MQVIIDGITYVPATTATPVTTVPPVAPVTQGDDLLEALELRFDSYAGEHLTLREYLCKLLTTLWDEGASFSGKSPFGNSNWEYEIYEVLIWNDYIGGTLDENGYVDNIDRGAAHAYVRNLILAAMMPPKELQR